MKLNEFIESLFQGIPPRGVGQDRLGAGGIETSVRTSHFKYSGQHHDGLMI